MEVSFSQVTIIGVGLIGGSIGLALKELPNPPVVIGLGRSESSLNTALAMGAVDKVTTRLEEAVLNSDLIVICTPVSRIIEYLKEIGRLNLKQNCLITDAGSTKQAIVDAAVENLPNPGSFIAAHPLGGSEKSKVSHASASLLKSARCLITPSQENTPEQIARIKNFWEYICCKVISMTASRHDHLLALTSHLPHLLAPALINLAGEWEEEEDELIEIFAGSFRDMTRVAGSDPHMWLDIFATNKENILLSIEKYEAILGSLKNALKNDDANALSEELTLAQNRRNRIYHGTKKLDD